MLLPRTRSVARRRVKFGAIVLLGFIMGELLCAEEMSGASSLFADGARAFLIQCAIRLSPLLGSA